MTPEQLSCLRVIAVFDGELDHDHAALEPFRNDFLEKDIFNQCHDEGWLESSFDDRIEMSTVYLTDEGRDAMTRELRKQADGS